MRTEYPARARAKPRLEKMGMKKVDIPIMLVLTISAGKPPNRHEQHHCSAAYFYRESAA